MNATPRQIQIVSNAELYNRWAKLSIRFLNARALTQTRGCSDLFFENVLRVQVYDTDGNILQAIDDLLLPPLLSRALDSVSSSAPITITELGSGTGRNTAKLLLPPLNSIINIQEINALDLSPAMLEVAENRCKSLLASKVTQELPILNFQLFDALDSSSSSGVNLERKADLVLSTLVLEHLPLDIFFQTVTRLLKSDGYLVLTNMHGDMGRISQAGFVDPETGEKVRGTSYVYDIEQVVEKAMKYGIEVAGNVEERAVGVDDIGEGRVLGARGTKWIGVKVWFGMVLRLHTRQVN